MPPANTSFATAVDLGALPADVTQTDIHDGGTGLNYTVYYKFTAPADAIVIGAWGFSTIADAYRTVIRPYLGPAGAPTQVLGIGGTNVPIQFPVTGGSEYFLEFSKTNNVAPTSLRVRVEVAPLGTIVNGNIMVNDDTHGFPMAIVSHLVDYTVINFRQNIVAGESGCRLPAGVIALEDRDTTSISFYSARDFSLIRNDTSFAAANLIIRSCLGANKFYIGSQTSPSVVKSFNTLGVVLATHTLSTNNIVSLAARNDETVLYYANNGVGEQIRRWDLVNDVALTDLTVGDAGIAIDDILYLANDTIVSVHENLVGNTVECRNYSPAGVLLHTYTCPNNLGSHSKLAYANDDPVSFWNWTHDSFTRSRFQNIRVSDGTVLTDRLQMEYEGGVYNGSETDTPVSRFGNSFSCPFMIYYVPAPPSMYILTPNKRTDTDGNQNVAIPNPTFKTGLIP